MQNEIKAFLNQFDVDPQRGFLPVNDPILSLPEFYSPWEATIAELSYWINAGVVRKELNKLPLLDTNQLERKEELERAMRVLGFLGHAFIWGDSEPVNYLPETIAIPWVNVAQKLGRPPILAHASLVLQNWRRIDTKGPIVVENLAILHHFHGGLDESWFYLLTVEIEQKGAIAVTLAAEAVLEAAKKEKEIVKESLIQLSTAIENMTKCLRRMREHCDPYIFYTRVRPFIASFNAIDYRGTSGNSIKSFSGGSAAQSSLFQYLDAALGVLHEEKESKQFLRQMQDYMPPQHAAFIRKTAEISTLRAFCEKEKELKEPYNNCLVQIEGFRKEHLKIVGLYIVAQAKKRIGPGALGTGGTNPIDFLREVTQDTKLKL